MLCCQQHGADHAQVTSRGVLWIPVESTLNEARPSAPTQKPTTTMHVLDTAQEPIITGHFAPEYSLKKSLPGPPYLILVFNIPTMR